MPTSEGDSHPVEHRRGRSGQRKKIREGEALAPCRTQRGTHQSSERKPTSDGHSPTAEGRENDLSGQREKQATKDTHVLLSAEGGTHQDSKIKSETRGAHVLPSGTCQDSEKCQRTMSTYQLSNARGDSSGQQEKLASRGHTLPVERRRRGRNLSG
jgi:hypothetical protein